MSMETLFNEYYLLLKNNFDNYDSEIIKNIKNIRLQIILYKLGSYNFDNYTNKYYDNYCKFLFVEFYILYINIISIFGNYNIYSFDLISYILSFINPVIYHIFENKYSKSCIYCCPPEVINKVFNKINTKFDLNLVLDITGNCNKNPVKCLCNNNCYINNNNNTDKGFYRMSIRFYPKKDIYQTIKMEQNLNVSITEAKPTYQLYYNKKSELSNYTNFTHYKYKNQQRYKHHNTRLH